MPLWSIKIEPNPAQIANQPGRFVPDVVGSEGEVPLKVLKGDLVSWNNETDVTHQPWPTDENNNMLPANTVGTSGSAKYLADQIPANASSSPSWKVIEILSGDQKNTIYYCCKEHPLERGRMQITG